MDHYQRMSRTGLRPGEPIPPERWEPTQNMIDYVDEMRRLGWGRGARARASKKVGLCYTSVGHWHRTPAFRTWWRQQAEEFAAERLPDVYSAIHEAAVKGGKHNASSQKLFLQRFDDAFRERTESSSRLEVNMPGANLDALLNAAEAALDGKPEAEEPDE